jgi:hypothetical protein
MWRALRANRDMAAWKFRFVDDFSVHFYFSCVGILRLGLAAQLGPPANETRRFGFVLPFRPAQIFPAFPASKPQALIPQVSAPVWSTLKANSGR